MAKNHLFKAVCTVVMLAAAPAFAQTNTETGSTGAGGAAVNPTAHETMPGSMAPADKSMGSHGGMMSHSTHRTAMSHTPASAKSQDAAVDQLNDRSYQAAHSGQAYTVGTATGGTSSSGNMNGMSGDAASNGASSSNGNK